MKKNLNCMTDKTDLLIDEISIRSRFIKKNIVPEGKQNEEKNTNKSIEIRCSMCNSMTVEYVVVDIGEFNNVSPGGKLNASAWYCERCRSSVIKMDKKYSIYSVNDEKFNDIVRSSASAVYYKNIVRDML